MQHVVILIHGPFYIHEPAFIEELRNKLKNNFFVTIQRNFWEQEVLASQFRPYYDKTFALRDPGPWLDAKTAINYRRMRDGARKKLEWVPKGSIILKLRSDINKVDGNILAKLIRLQATQLQSATVISFTTLADAKASGHFCDWLVIAKIENYRQFFQEPDEKTIAAAEIMFCKSFIRNGGIFFNVSSRYLQIHSAKYGRLTPKHQTLVLQKPIINSLFMVNLIYLLFENSWCISKYMRNICRKFF